MIPVNLEIWRVVTRVYPSGQRKTLDEVLAGTEAGMLPAVPHDSTRIHLRGRVLLSQCVTMTVGEERFTVKCIERVTERMDEDLPGSRRAPVESVPEVPVLPALPPARRGAKR